MSFPRFQLHPPGLLSSSTPPNNTGRQLSPTIQDLVGVTWNMIASSSSMWQDRKHSITIQYSAPADSADGGAFSELTTWYAKESNKESSTKGYSWPLNAESRYTYNWRGAGWLRMISTRWEIVGLGVLPGEGGGGVTENGVVVLVTFVQKTLFSPQALSILIRKERLDNAQEEKVTSGVRALLRSLGQNSLDAEVEKLTAIPRN